MQTLKAWINQYGLTVWKEFKLWMESREIYNPRSATLHLFLIYNTDIQYLLPKNYPLASVVDAIWVMNKTQ